MLNHGMNVFTRGCAVSLLQRVRQCSLARWYATASVELRQREHEANVRFLQCEDQRYLEDVRINTDYLIREVRKTEELFKRVPTRMEFGPTQVTTFKKLSELVAQAPARAQAVVDRAEHLKEHLEDLKYEPYPERTEPSTAAFEREIAGWSEEQKREELQNLMFQEEASAKRLQDSSERLLASVKGLRERTQRPKEEKVENPFEGERRLVLAADPVNEAQPPHPSGTDLKGTSVPWQSQQEVETKPAKKAEAKPDKTLEPKRVSSLAALQARLDQSIKGG